MGWKKGDGLGKNNEGIKKPIKARMWGGVGIGYGKKPSFVTLGDDNDLPGFSSAGMLEDAHRRVKIPKHQVVDLTITKKNDIKVVDLTDDLDDCIDLTRPIDLTAEIMDLT